MRKALPEASTATPLIPSWPLPASAAVKASWVEAPGLSFEINAWIPGGEFGAPGKDLVGPIDQRQALGQPGGYRWVEREIAWIGLPSDERE